MQAVGGEPARTTHDERRGGRPTTVERDAGIDKARPALRHTPAHQPRDGNTRAVDATAAFEGQRNIRPNLQARLVQRQQAAQLAGPRLAIERNVGAHQPRRLDGAVLDHPQLHAGRQARRTRVHGAEVERAPRLHPPIAALHSQRNRGTVVGPARAQLGLQAPRRHQSCAAAAGGAIGNRCRGPCSRCAEHRARRHPAQ